MTSPHDKAKDQYLDAALQRVVGNESPPDLSTNILAALEGQHEDAQSENLRALSTQRRRKRLGLAAAAACAVLGLGLISYEYLAPTFVSNPAELHQGLLFSDNAEYEIENNTISLQSGWLLLSNTSLASSLAVDTGTTQVQGVDGSLLITASSDPDHAPDEEDLVTIQTGYKPTPTQRTSI